MSADAFASKDICCPRCGRKVGEMDGLAVVRIRCPRCKLLVQFPALTAEIVPDPQKTSNR